MGGVASLRAVLVVVVVVVVGEAPILLSARAVASPVALALTDCPAPTALLLAAAGTSTLPVPK